MTTQKPRLSRDAIVTMGIAVLEQDGPDGLSARRLASRLGCEAMSLYRHVSSMDDLQDAMVDHLLGAVAPPPGVDPAAIPILRAAEGFLDLAQHFPNSFRADRHPPVAHPARRRRRPGPGRSLPRAGRR